MKCGLWFVFLVEGSILRVVRGGYEEEEKDDVLV